MRDAAEGGEFFFEGFDFFPANEMGGTEGLRTTAISSSSSSIWVLPDQGMVCSLGSLKTCHELHELTLNIISGIRGRLEIWPEVLALLF